MNKSFIAYPKAIKLLSKRLNATPYELAVWLLLNDGNLVAYTNANELSPPPEFNYGYFANTRDYLKPLMYCWFLQEDIEKFEPSDRYITGSMLLERWAKYLEIDAQAFIHAKIAESRLQDIHPTFGMTQASWESDDFPPISEGMFSLSEIERIEQEDMSLNDEENSHFNHDLTMQDQANHIANNLSDANRKSPSKKQVVTELQKIYPHLSRGTIMRRIRKKWEE